MLQRPGVSSGMWSRSTHSLTRLIMSNIYQDSSTGEPGKQTRLSAEEKANPVVDSVGGVLRKISYWSKVRRVRVSFRYRSISYTSPSAFGIPLPLYLVGMACLSGALRARGLSTRGGGSRVRVR